MFSHFQSYAAKGGQHFQCEVCWDHEIQGGEGKGVSSHGWELHAPDLVFTLSLCCLCSSKLGQGNTRALLRREQGQNYNRMFFDNYRGKRIWPRDCSFHLLRTFTQCLHVCFSFRLFPHAPRATAYLLLLLSLLPTVASAQCSHREFECQYLCLEMNGKVFVTQRQSFFK